MTTNKPGSVNQRPLYGCTSCYEEVLLPASNLRVYDGECWCDMCWAERQWELPGRPCWNDLESYTPTPLPAEQKTAPDEAGLVEALESAYHLIANHSGETLPTRYASDQMDMIEAALAADRKQQEKIHEYL